MANATVTLTLTAAGTYTWTAPAGVTAVLAEAWGGGGGGADNSGNCAGGAGGEYAAEAVLAVTPGSTYTLVVGAAGAGNGGGSNGTPGSSSTVAGDSVTVTAHGGGAGAGTTPGAGGTGSANTTHFDGGAGGAAGTGTASGGSGGGSAGTGSAGNPGNAGVTSGGSNPGASAVTGGGPGGAGGPASSGSGAAPVSGPGGGGGGAGNNLSANSGNGFAGQVRLTFTVASPVTLATPGTYSWTAPAGTAMVDAAAWGGGGGGSRRQSSSIGGNGAGGGEYAEETALVITPGNAYTLVVGAAGAGGSTATDGGSSTFAGDAITVTAHGGSHATTAAAGAGGTGSANTIHFNGGAGNKPSSGAAGGGGGGSAGPSSIGTTAVSQSGASAVTGGGPGGNGGATGAGSAPASGPGGGGGGSGDAASSTNGGNGFAGQVTLTWGAGAASTATDQAQFAPGPTWLKLFKPGLPRAQPLTQPPFIAMVTTSGSATLAPYAVAGSVQASAPPMDLPAIRPGPAWLAHFKPFWLPKPPLAAAPQGGLYFGNQPNPRDIPAIRPGPTWLDLFKPGLPRPKPPVPPATPTLVNAGTATLAPYATSGTATVFPVASGSASLAPYATSGTVGVPVVDVGVATVAPFKTSGAVKVPVVATGTATLAPYTVATPATLRDMPQFLPGPTWLAHFKRHLTRRTLKVNGNAAFTGTRGTASLAPYKALGFCTVLSPFPEFILNLKFELLVNGTWTDITAFVYQRDDIVISRGLPNEAQSATPQQMTFTLNNRDGRFSPLNTAGAYYPYLTQNAQVRVSIVNQSSAGGASVYSGYRFWGELSSIPPSWDNTGSDVYVQATASGPLRRYVQSAKMGSALEQYNVTLTSTGSSFAPYAAWPCEDGQSATQFASLLATGTAMTFTGKPGLSSFAGFGGSDPLPTISGSVWHGQTGAPADPPGTGSITKTTPGTYTFTAPPGVTAVTSVTCIGAGGGGGDTDGTTGGSGGGGGGNAASTSVSVTGGNTYTYVVGAGGAAGALGAGSAGANSTFTGSSTTVTGHGGSGGGYAGSTPGTGGSGTHNGGAGGTGQSSSTSFNSNTIYGTTGSTGGGSGGSAGSNSLNWTATPGTTTVSALTQAGGGGGSGASGNTHGGFPGDGGGGGGLSSGTVNVTPGNSYTVQAGNGGNGSSTTSDATPNGDSGGDSSFQGDSGSVSSSGGGGAGGPDVNTDNPGFPGTGGSGNLSSGGDGESAFTDFGLGGVSGDGTPGGAYGGGSGSSGSGGGAAGGGGGYGYVQWSWEQTGSPAGGGGGGAGGTSFAGNAGSSSGTGGASVTGGGAGGSTGSTPSGFRPGGGGAGAVPSNPSVGNTAYTAGSGAAGQVSFSWSGGTTSPVAADIIRFALQVDAGGAADGSVLLSALTYGTVAEVDVVYHTGGFLELIGYNASSVQVFDSGPVAFSADGADLYVSVELTGSGANVVWKLTAITPGSGTVVATSTGSVTGSVGNVSDVYVNPDGTVTDSGTALGWVTVQTVADTLANVSPVVNGYAGETAAARVSRLCAAQGLAFTLAGNAADTPLMGPMQDDTFVNVVQSCADLDRGQLYELRNAFGIGYRTRKNLQGQAPAVVALYGQAMIAYPLQPTYDDQFTRNSVTVTRSGGASSTAQLTTGRKSVLTPPLGAGLYTYSATVQANNDGQLANLASWIMQVGTVDEYRFPVIPFNLARAEVAALFGTLAGLEVGDYIQVPDPPSFLQLGPIRQLCFGFTETLSAFRWLISVNAVPQSPYGQANPPTW